MAAHEPASDLGAFVRQMQPRVEGHDRYSFESAAMGQRQFGGITIGQALVAAAQTVSGLQPHELHILFLRPHAPGSTVQYAVDRLRDGRRFHTRRVRALEGERLLSETTVSFTTGGSGFAFQAPAPVAPPPDDLPVFVPAGRPPAEGHAVRRRGGFLFDQRLVNWTGPSANGRNVLDLWVRAIGEPPDDALLRAAALAALSDLSSQMMGIEPDDDTRHAAATLSHTLWLHQVPPLDDWLLFVRESSVATSGRVLMTGTIYTRGGLRCATLAQESLLAEE